MTIADGQRLSYLGHEIVISEAMPTSTGDLSDEAMLLFGDMQSAATMGVRRDIRIATDESRYFELDQVAIKGTERYDIVVHDCGTATDAGAVVALIGE